MTNKETTFTEMNLTIVALVAVVAIVGIVALVMNAAPTTSSLNQEENLVGAPHYVSLGVSEERSEDDADSSDEENTVAAR